MSNTKVTCPKCNVINRIPMQRLTDVPNCGKCKKPLFFGKPMELTAVNVAATLNHNEIPVLVDCWAPGVALVKILGLFLKVQQKHWNLSYD